MIICKKRIISLDFLKNYNDKNIKIGIHVTNKEYEILGFNEFEEGIMIEPDPCFGVNCYKNANGYSFPDKTKPKEYRVVNTIYWTWKDWGGNEHSKLCDISKKVYPKVEVPASNIEFMFKKNNNGEPFIIANLDTREESIIKQTINMFLEIFGFCEIFDEDLELLDINNKIKRCNWELLPPGVKAVAFSKKEENKEKKKHVRPDFNQFRLDALYLFNPKEVYQGTKGFAGYYAFIYKNTCFLENGFYGNATYIVPKSKWKELSQLSKQEVLSTNCLIEKVNHTADWLTRINQLMNKIENTK